MAIKAGRPFGPLASAGDQLRLLFQELRPFLGGDHAMVAAQEIDAVATIPEALSVVAQADLVPKDGDASVVTLGQPLDIVPAARIRIEKPPARKNVFDCLQRDVLPRSRSASA